MTLFGKSLFETVMAGIDARKEEEETSEDVSNPGIRGLNAGFVGRDFHGDHRAEIDPAGQFEDYPPELEALLSTRDIKKKVEEPSWINRLTDAEIAEDIGLSDDLTRQQLQESRRRFARDNHPDRVAQEYQAIANVRMMAANQLIDRALKKAKG